MDERHIAILEENDPEIATQILLSMLQDILEKQAPMKTYQQKACKPNEEKLTQNTINLINDIKVQSKIATESNDIEEIRLLKHMKKELKKNKAIDRNKFNTNTLNNNIKKETHGKQSKKY